MALRNNQDVDTAFTDIATFLVNGLVTMALFYGAIYSYFQRRSIYSAWLILAVATLSFTIGDIVYAYDEVVLKVDPFLSIANIFFIAYYPLFLLGIFSLPSNKFANSERFKTMLDTGIAMVSAILTSGAPSSARPSRNGKRRPPLFISLYSLSCYGFGYAFPVLELLFRRIYQNDQTPLLFLAGGMISRIITDSVYLHLSWVDAYVAGGLLDLGWPLAYVLFGLAGLSQADAVAKGSSLKLVDNLQPRYGQLSWPLYLPYVCAAGAFALLIWSHDNPIVLLFLRYPGPWQQ